jgi:hypothetical protein
VLPDPPPKIRLKSSQEIDGNAEIQICKIGPLLQDLFSPPALNLSSPPIQGPAVKIPIFTTGF